MRAQFVADTQVSPTRGPIGVVGLWHLGCTIVAGWLRLGREVIAVDVEGTTIADILAGRLPVQEPGVMEAFVAGLRTGKLRLSGDPVALAECAVIFIAHDTVVRDDDSSDLTAVWATLEMVGAAAPRGAVVVVSAQVPVGTARGLRSRLQAHDASLELAYVPENLRLGEALECYLRPGYTVIGSASETCAAITDQLFASLPTERIHMSLESAELAKHATNAFLATSVSLANHWADVASVVSADYASVERALRADRRIGESAYISAGIGFSGGTLGRDLRVLANISDLQLEGGAPLFEATLRYNLMRADRLAGQLAVFLGAGPARVAILGMTYKPGTSTLRRSRPLEIAAALLDQGISVAAHDPGADWTRSSIPDRLEVAATPYDAAMTADALLILTGWPEYRALDIARLASSLRHRRVLDPIGVLRGRELELSEAGFKVGRSMVIPPEWRT